MPIYPNKAKKQSDKVKLLKKLKFEFEKALDKGWNPLMAMPEESEPELSLEQSIQKVVDSKLSGNYSRTYTRDIVASAKHFFAFLTKSEREVGTHSYSSC